MRVRLVHRHAHAERFVLNLSDVLRSDHAIVLHPAGPRREPPKRLFVAVGVATKVALCLRVDVAQLDDQYFLAVLLEVKLDTEEGERQGLRINGPVRVRADVSRRGRWWGG